MTEKELNYDEAIARLEAIVIQLEKGGTKLDETLAIFEEGSNLLKLCQKELIEAEGRLSELKLNDIEEEVNQY